MTALYYLVPPRITVPAENYTEVVTRGNTVTIMCVALGYPPPTIVWNKINGTLSDRVSLTNDSVPVGSGNIPSVRVNLTITAVDMEDMGIYQCDAGNGVSRYINITVLGMLCV